MELSLLRKSDPLFCPSYRPPSLSRPRIITLSSRSSPLLVSPLISNQPLLPPPSHSNNNKISSPSHHITYCLHPPTPPLPLTISFLSTPHVCLISPISSYTTHNASPSSLIFSRMQFFHVLLSFQYQHSLSHIRQPRIVSHFRSSPTILIFQIAIAKPSKP